ncbi:unnamed protein product [Cladocopium goreaui]|uniref:Uncharacterized protein n=1 Tax=Cladocopium goreaui TaxID=2562237 RepID=A0A9P1CVT4_9DINO|nr:unnamed protein product [Cladocopium goreaui]CAI4016747.1 unnamed protein product [Cladocopium goreaui]
MQASSEALRMWRTESGRSKLKEMLMQHGNFSAVECEIVRIQKTTMDNSKQGGWVTRHFLIGEKHWTKPMVDAAVDWAKNRNLWRVNPIHKEEEIKIVVEDFFKYTDQQAYETSQRGTMEMEDPEGALLESGDLIPEQMSRLLPEVGDDKTPEEEAQPGTGASFRLVFPTLQQNSSPLSVMTAFMETLGRKIDQADREKDRLLQKKTEKADQIVKSLANLIDLLNKGYDNLSKLQGEALTGSIEVGVIKQAMNDITKTDVAMNNILLRSQPQRADTVKAAKPKASPKVKAKAKDKVPRVRKGSKAKSKARKTHPKTEAEGDDES